MIKVALPTHLRILAGTERFITLEVEGTPTLGAVLDALEIRCPVLRGTIRDHATKERRPFIRFFACEQDISLDPPGTPLPGEIASGAETLWIVGALAGG